MSMVHRSFPQDAENAMAKKRGGEFTKTAESRVLTTKLNEDKETWKQLLGAEAIDIMEEIEAQDQPLRTAYEKLRLQAKVKGDFPCCEKCRHYIDPKNVVQPVTTISQVFSARSQTPDNVNCDLGKRPGEVAFKVGEVYNPEFDIEICRDFIWVKE